MRLDTSNPVVKDGVTYHFLSDLHPLCAEDTSAVAGWIRNIATRGSIAKVRGRLAVREKQVPLVVLWVKRRGETRVERSEISNLFVDLAGRSVVFKAIPKETDNAR